MVSRKAERRERLLDVSSGATEQRIIRRVSAQRACRGWRAARAPVKKGRARIQIQKIDRQTIRLNRDRNSNHSFNRVGQQSHTLRFVSRFAPEPFSPFLN